MENDGCAEELERLQLKEGISGLRDGLFGRFATETLDAGNRELLLPRFRPVESGGRWRIRYGPVVYVISSRPYVASY